MVLRYYIIPTWYRYIASLARLVVRVGRGNPLSFLFSAPCVVKPEFTHSTTTLWLVNCCFFGMFHWSTHAHTQLLAPCSHLAPWSHAYFFFFFSILFIMFALLFSLPPSRNSDPGSHSRLFSRPTHYGSCLAFFFSREDFSSFFPRRLASNYVTKYGDILYINVWYKWSLYDGT